MKLKCLIWESNSLQAIYLKQLYLDGGFEVKTHSTYGELKESVGLYSDLPILIVIGSTDPKTLKRISVLHHLAPYAAILILSSQQDLNPCVQAFQAGADAYLTTPISPTLLLEQSQALISSIRRVLNHKMIKSTHKTLKQGTLNLDLATQELKTEKNTCSLKAREFALLHYFFSHPNQVLSRESICHTLWLGEVSPKSRQLDNLILSLRKKLSIDPQLEIKTVFKAGFIFKN